MIGLPGGRRRALRYWGLSPRAAMAAEGRRLGQIAELPGRGAGIGGIGHRTSRDDEDAQSVGTGAGCESFVGLAALGADARREEPGLRRGGADCAQALEVVSGHDEADRIGPGTALPRDPGV